LKDRVTEAMPLVKRIPVVVEIDCRALTNRVNISVMYVAGSADRMQRHKHVAAYPIEALLEHTPEH
jgi:hypothetical protein